MTDSYLGLRLLLVALIIVVNGFFAAAEVSLLSVRNSRLRQLAEEGNSGAQAALNLLANPERLLSVTQVGVTLASLGLGWAGEETLFHLFSLALGPVAALLPVAVLHGIAFVAAFGLMSFCHVVLGEVVPKNVAIERADRLAVTVAPVLLVFYRISSPFVAVVERTSTLISRLVGVRGRHGGGHSPEELKYIVSASRGMGFLPAVQEDIIHRALDLENVSVREIMVGRNDIVSVSDDAGLEAVLDTMISEQHSRLPVYHGEPEHIVGILHYKDLLPVWQERKNAIRVGRPPRGFRVTPLLRKLLVVPETKPVLQLLEEFRKGGTHMAVVVDEFGTIVGLLTVEDILEQIVGPIEDEHDEKTPRGAVEARVLELDGGAKIRELESEYGIEVPGDAGFETLAGFLLFRFGAIPKEGDGVEYDGRIYTVIELDRHRIARVRIEKLAVPASE